jgi:hypothetical protein
MEQEHIPERGWLDTLFSVLAQQDPCVLDSLPLIEGSMTWLSIKSRYRQKDSNCPNCQTWQATILKRLIVGSVSTYCTCFKYRRTKPEDAISATIKQHKLRYI